MVANATDTSAKRPLTVRIKRQDTPDGTPRWEEFRVEVAADANVISVLQSVAASPTTTEGKPSTPVCYDAGCLEEVCGSCTMVINGRVRQACSALVRQVATPDGAISLEPMSKFPVIRDLSVDRSRLFHNLERVKAWVPIDSTFHLGAGPKESPESQEKRYVMSTCMSCGCCLEACPQFTHEGDAAAWDTSFVGAHAINQARLFNAHATGATLKSERLDVLMGQGGVSDCGNAQNCVKVCPKEIPLTESIAEIGRQVTVRSISRFFGGK